MRGSNQIGHDAVVVWSPTFEDHVADVQAQLAHGCTLRLHGSFQRGESGLIFTWLNVPRNRCGLCAGVCRQC
jgi:hypothetical protein